MKVIVVYNPKSGSARPKASLKRMFTNAGLSVEKWIDVTLDTAEETLRTLKTSPVTVAAIGGDGTIASVATQLAGGKAILAPLPGGTLNHFTKDVGITQDLPEAIKRIPTSRKTKIDYATVNGRVFLNNSSIGIYPVSLQTRKRFEDRLGKWPAAIVASVRAFVRFKLYRVTINGKTFKTPFIFIGNNTYHLEHGAERKTLNGGKLCAYAIASDKRYTVVKLIWAALTKKLHTQEEFIEAHPLKLTIHTKRPQVSVSTDGEVLRLNSPLAYECHPGGLTIIGNS